MKINFLKTLYIIINLSIITALCICLYHNWDKSVVYTCALFNQDFTLKLGYIIIGSFLTAYLAGYTACLFIKTRTDVLCNAYQKRHENISIEKDENKAKIATLEAKIQTLEVALESALRNK